MVRALLLGLGCALGVNAAWLAFTANLNLGMALVAVVALGLIAWALWHQRLPRPLHITAAVLCLAVIGMAAFLAGYGTRDNARFDEDAVIVLGAAVHGSELSKTLIRRLDVAVAYHERNPGALIVVSGGQGPQEDLPEAVAMQQYLVSTGIPAESVITEDRATSTEENFAFSRALLDRRLPSGYPVAFVTDEFHVYRAGRIAAAAGLDATHVSSRTPWYFWPSNYLRETLAVVTSWLSQTSPS
nr:YdcF family protein [Propionicimonas sp.]